MKAASKATCAVSFLPWRVNLYSIRGTHHGEIRGYGSLQIS